MVNRLSYRQLYSLFDYEISVRKFQKKFSFFYFFFIKLLLISSKQFKLSLGTDHLALFYFFLIIKNSFCFNYLIDSTCFLFKNKVFNVIFLSSSTNYFHISLEKESSLNLFYSITHLFPAANWPEREIKDLFGSFFIFNKELRRLITDYGFKGHPLVKEFPSCGFFEIARSQFTQSLFYKPAKFLQKNYYVSSSKFF